MSIAKRTNIPSTVLGRRKDGVIVVEAVNKKDIAKGSEGIEPIVNAFMRATIDTCEKVTVDMLKGLGFVKQEWISVKDRLPEYDSHFLGYTFGGNMIVGFYWAVEWDKAFGFITHWMPLPEPPYAASQPEKE